MDLPDTHALQSTELPDAGRLRPGQLFRGLTVHSELGQGGMGQAYVASHPVLQVPLVVKTFRAVDSGDLFAEAHLAARVASPRVVPVIDAGVEDGVPFVIQVYVDGIDLAELMACFTAMGRRLPLAAVCRLVCDTAEGLHAIHQAGVVHRDVKPSNLFLRGDGRAMVGDFGVARPVGAAQGAVSGTPQFMAPEQWGAAAVDRRADVFALGAAARLMLSPDESPEAAYLLATLERCVEPQPHDRYPTAAAVLRQLNTIRQPMPRVTLTSPDSAQVADVRVTLHQGDLAAVEADVLVNAANGELTMRLGVAEALRAAGGDGIEREAASHAPAAMGEVVWTGAGALKATSVAHAVAASTGGAICLGRATLRTLLGAEARGAGSIAFPALGTGLGEVPIEQAAQLMLGAIRTFASLSPQQTRDVRIVLWDDVAFARWRQILRWM